MNPSEGGWNAVAAEAAEVAASAEVAEEAAASVVAEAAEAAASAAAAGVAAVQCSAGATVIAAEACVAAVAIETASPDGAGMDRASIAMDADRAAYGAAVTGIAGLAVEAPATAVSVVAKDAGDGTMTVAAYAV